MLGAIIGDIAGSRFEFHNLKSKQFDFLTYQCYPTDDTNMTLAVAQAILKCNGDWTHLAKETVHSMQALGRKYPDDFGCNFHQWVWSDTPQPYNSWGNGAAMRVSSCAHVATSLDEALHLAKTVTTVTHNHPEGIKGAEAVTVAIFMAKSGKSMLDIRDYINNAYYPLTFRLNEIRDDYSFDESCQGCVPQAIEAFLESSSFEDAIRNAISIGGDSDTLAAITGSIAEAYYGIPAEIRNHALTFLDEPRLAILNTFEQKYGLMLAKRVSEDTTRIVTFTPSPSTQNVEEEDVRQKTMLKAVEATTTALHNNDAESRETTANLLFNYLYEACNILRGPINQDEYKSYTIPILFLKRISDCYDEETEAAQAIYGDEVKLYPEEELHSFIIPKECHWENIRDRSEDVGKAITDAMMGIEQANPDLLAGLFSSFDDANWTDKTKLNDERLKNLIEHMSQISVGNNNYSADVMGDAYEYLIKKFADLSKKNAGEFYTPRTIIKLMVQLLDPKAGETVYDPACGTGGMLIEAIRQMHNAQSAYGKIFGQEKNLSTSAIARMNLFLHGAKEFSIRREDTLNNPQFLSGGRIRQFDCVLANPPFGLKSWGAEAFANDQWGRCIWGCPSDSNADFAWIQHMVCSMKQSTGRCAVIMPQGVLFHGGKEGDIRKQLIESDKLEAVITLVGGVFFSAGVSACILYLNNNKPESHKGKVCMIDGSTIYTAKRAQNIMTEEDISKVWQLWQNYRNVIDLCAIVDLNTLRKKGHTLTVNSFIEKSVATTIDPAQVRQEFNSALKEVREAEAELTHLLKEGGYIDG